MCQLRLASRAYIQQTLVIMIRYDLNVDKIFYFCNLFILSPVVFILSPVMGL